MKEHHQGQTFSWLIIWTGKIYKYNVFFGARFRPSTCCTHQNTFFSAWCNHMKYSYEMLCFRNWHEGLMQFGGWDYDRWMFLTCHNVEQLYTMTLAGKPWTAEMSRLGIHDYYWNAEVFVCPNFVTRPFVDTTQEVLEQKWTRQGFSNPQGIKLRTSQLVWITPPVTTLPMLLDPPTLTRNMMFEQKHTKTVDYTYLQAPLSQWCCFA